MDKIISTKRITLIDSGEVVSTRQDTTHVLNSSFSIIVTNLKTLEYPYYDPAENNISDPILKLIVKYIGITLA